MGNISKAALIALKLIKRLSLTPSREILKKDSLIKRLPGVVRESMTKSARTKKRTHLR